MSQAAFLTTARRMSAGMPLWRGATTRCAMHTSGDIFE